MSVKLAIAIKTPARSLQKLRIAGGVCAHRVRLLPIGDDVVRGTTPAMLLIVNRNHSPKKYNSRCAECQNVDHPFRLVALTISDLSYATANQVQESEFVASLTTGKWLKGNHTSRQTMQ